MAGVNKVILLGNLGSDPEVRHLENGSAVARFNIATSESYTNRNGERVEQTEWHRIELWDNLAKIAEQYLRKGNTVYIEGKLRTETWVDKEGKQREGKTVRANTMQLVGGRNNSEAGNAEYTPAPAAQASRPAPAKPATPIATDLGGSGDDDLPF
ncbi:single-stranded DNA-binding protein [Runella sp. MFBS21]|uniref:single-stranded DNA-binding protein n=1 Tax=Runella sp. MFBS21 TaxID=3034018 RepID=UPI0023F8E4C4|nr:single-stranded DNA-binding protein [Runella sp. MFBS21]MDF7821097.1 single-stranded DNA-binding protein [Runella sp. MFBS21]